MATKKEGFHDTFLLTDSKDKKWYMSKGIMSALGFLVYSISKGALNHYGVDIPMFDEIFVGVCGSLGIASFRDMMGKAK